MEIDSDSRGVIVAPAGHGKTHLIGTRVATAGAHERLLVLTHTNIAVRAVRRRLPPRRAAHVRVETIDAMSFRIASSFPSAAGLSGIPIAPQAIDWHAIREGARRALNFRAIRHAFTSSYSGLIVDEFQDCSRIQLDLILTISQDMPAVVLGDPLQALYEFDAGRIDWQERTSGHEMLGTLDTPWRWSSSNTMASWLSLNPQIG